MAVKKVGNFYFTVFKPTKKMCVMKLFRKMLTHNKMHKNNINRKDKKPHKKQTQKKYTQELWQNFIETVEFYSC